MKPITKPISNVHKNINNSEFLKAIEITSSAAKQVFQAIQSMASTPATSPVKPVKTTGRKP